MNLFLLTYIGVLTCYNFFLNETSYLNVILNSIAEIKNPVMDTEVLTEVPVVLKKLVRMIARGFYTMEHAIVVDLLVKHPCIKVII